MSLGESCPSCQELSCPLKEKAYMVSQSRILEVHKKMEMTSPAGNLNFYLEP